jgi:uncharacterized protein (TIGR02147 family)
MRSIFEYTDYRAFLKDLYQEKKRDNPSYSFRCFSNRAGFKSKSFIQHVIDGRRNLSDDSIEKLNRVLKLTGKQLSYFSALVSFNQAKTRELRMYHWSQLCAFNPRNPLRLLMKDQYEYFTKWYHKTVRELVCSVDFGDEYEYLGKLLTPPISAREARKSVQLLLKLGLIRKMDRGYVQTDAFLTTGDEVQSLAVQNFHHENLGLARRAIDSIPRDDRDISTLVVALSDNTFRQIKNEIRAFRKRLLGIVNSEESHDGVYHINFHLFPTTRKLTSAKDGSE